MLTPDELLKKAHETEVIPRRDRWAGVYEAAQVLRGKGMTWREIHQWMESNGIDITYTNLIAVGTKPKRVKS